MKRISNYNRFRYITRAGIIAAVYIVLTGLSAVFGMSSGIVQVRISEALCVLPVICSAAIPGVTLGCFISNLFFGGTVFDIVFGTLATFVGAVIARFMKKMPYLSPIPTVIVNTAVIPCVLVLSGLGEWEMFPYFALMVGVGEIISCGLFGDFFLFLIKKTPVLIDTVSD